MHRMPGLHSAGIDLCQFFACAHSTSFSEASAWRASMSHFLTAQQRVLDTAEVRGLKILKQYKARMQLSAGAGKAGKKSGTRRPPSG